MESALQYDAYRRSFALEFSYNKLWKLLIDNNMMKKDLMAKTAITSTTMAKMSKGLPVNMEIIGRICKAMNVNVGDIVDYIGDNQEKEQL
jgi:DNA-binding Xre family transcriptional regulator